ncbi:hypothetical protein Sm713_82560 [Streptomyces sp. TS71-3]|nr:hypothetical protein Sm713_82560 [Streptomyces sp. TS71-3]
MVAMGGDCLADVGMLRAEPVVFGTVASDPTVSCLIEALASSGGKALRALRAARAEVREGVWRLSGDRAPHGGGAVTVDLDGVLVIAHSDKEDAAPTWKRTFVPSPADGVRRPRCGWDRGARCCPATAGQRGIKHRRRSHDGHPSGLGPTTEGVPAGTPDPDPQRFRGRDT